MPTIHHVIPTAKGVKIPAEAYHIRQDCHGVDQWVTYWLPDPPAEEVGKTEAPHHRYEIRTVGGPLRAGPWSPITISTDPNEHIRGCLETYEVIRCQYRNQPDLAFEYRKAR